MERMREKEIVFMKYFFIEMKFSVKKKGNFTFGGRPLHSLSPEIFNPYQQVLSLCLCVSAILDWESEKMSECCVTQ
jgi:hypothetical protein